MKREIKFPCYIQPKLNGVRCIAVNSELYSRYGNIFTTLPHIKEDLLNNKCNIILDGELFSNDICCEVLLRFIRKRNKTPAQEKKSLTIYYNIFDYIETSLSYEERLANLQYYFKKNNFKYIRLVKTEKCYERKEITNFLEKYSDNGYEGIIIRNIEGKYEPGGRSIHLQKLRKFLKTGFDIIDYTTKDYGKDKGCVIWVCLCHGRIFHVKHSGSVEERRQLYLNGKKYVGKQLIVRYQELTMYGTPKYGIGIGFK